jgi:hypothetical protein
MKGISKVVFIFCIFFLLAACDGGSMAMAHETPDSKSTIAALTPTLQKPSPVPLVMGTGSTSIHYGRFNFSIFKSGIIDEKSENKVSVRNSDKTAWMRVQTDYTLYELAPDDFMNYCQNSIENLFTNVQDFQHDEIFQDEEKIQIYSTCKYYGQVYKTLNIFLHSSNINESRHGCVYIFSFWAPESHWNSYYEVFNNIYESRFFKNTSPLAYPELNEEFFINKPYVLSGGEISIEIPIGWSILDTKTVSNEKKVESFLSPDETMQIHAVRVGESTYFSEDELYDAAVFSIMEIFGEDLDISKSSKSMDGSVQLDWTSFSGDLICFSKYFTNKSNLYILSFVYSGDQEEIKIRLFETIWENVQSLP